MNLSRRTALIVFMVSFVAILAAGLYRAVMDEDAGPDVNPTASVSSEGPG